MHNTIKKMFGVLLICAAIVPCVAQNVQNIPPTPPNTENASDFTQIKKDLQELKAMKEVKAMKKDLQELKAMKEVKAMQGDMKAMKEDLQELKAKRAVSWVDWIVIILGSSIVVLCIGFFTVKGIVKNALDDNDNISSVTSTLNSIKSTVEQNQKTQTGGYGPNAILTSIKNKIDNLPYDFSAEINNFCANKKIIEHINEIANIINSDVYKKAMENARMDLVDKEDMAAFAKISHDMRTNVIDMMDTCLKSGVIDKSSLEDKFRLAQDCGRIDKLYSEADSELVKRRDRIKHLEGELKLLKEYQKIAMPDELKDNQGLQELHAKGGDLRYNAAWTAFLNLYWTSKVTTMKPSDIKQGFIRFDELLYAFWGNEQQELAKIRKCFYEAINTNVLGMTPYSVKWPALESNLWPNPDFTKRNWYNCEAGNGNVVAKVRSAAIFKDNELEAPARITSR